MSGAVDCRRRSLAAVGDLHGRDAGYGPYGAPRPSWRKWSVIMCPGEGRGPPRPLQLADPSAVCGCTCGNTHRAPRHQQQQQQQQQQQYQQLLQRDQDVRFREQHYRRPPLLRAFSQHEAPPERPAAVPPAATPPPGPPLSVAHSWTSTLRVPPLKRHLTHTGAFALPPSVDPSRTPSRTSPEEHDSWMPTTRRLLLEPAPHRVTTQGVPYGGPALRTPPPTPPPTPRSSAFRHVASPEYFCSGEIVYELRPGPVPGVSFTVPVFGSMVVRSPQEAGFGPQLPKGVLSGGVPPLTSTAFPGSLPIGLPDEPPLASKKSLRVLRPDELELRKPTVAAPAPTHAPAGDPGDDAKKGAFTEVADKAGSPVAPREPQAPQPATEVDSKSSKRQWLLRVVRENFNEQIGTLVERFVRRPRHDKSVRRVPGVGRKVNINLQDFWRRSSGQERHMKTKDLLTVYTESRMDWRAFQRWLTKDLQFMPSCAKLTALSLDIYQRYWSKGWVDDEDADSPP